MQRTSRFSTQARDAWIASLVQEAGGLPAVLAVRHRKVRKRSVQTPARRTSTSGLAARQSGLPIGRASRFCAEARDAWQASLVQEAGAACRIVWTPPHAAEASSRCGCRKQPRVARRASTVGWPRNATSTPFGLVGRDEARPTNGFSPGGPTPEVGTRRLPTLPDEGRIGSRWQTTCHRTPVGLAAVTKSRPSAQESRSKLGRIRMWSGSFSGKETP